MSPQPALERQRQKAQTRSVLKEAAVTCLRETGFADTRIGDITRVAGVAPGTFYVHFESKEALLDELLTEFNEGLVQRLAPIWSEVELDAAAALDPEALVGPLRRTAEAFLDYWEAHRDFVRFYADRLPSGLTVETLRDGINPQAAGLLAEGLQRIAGRWALDPGVVQLAVHGLLALWARVGLQYLFSGDLSRQRTADTLARLSRGALESLRRAPGEER